jgi:hypothetical protein
MKLKLFLAAAFVATIIGANWALNRYGIVPIGFGLYAPAGGYRAAYVLQNGCQRIPDDCDAVFTGGDTAFKLGDQAQRLAAVARRRGLWTHMGRVNSLRRLRFAAHHNYDSVDGTFLTFGPNVNLPRLLRYMRIAEHPTLWSTP